jgi:hypothetical protein
MSANSSDPLSSDSPRLITIIKWALILIPILIALIVILVALFDPSVGRIYTGNMMQL